MLSVLNIKQNGLSALMRMAYATANSQFGVTNYHLHRFLTAVNQSNTETLKYLVELY